MPSHSDLTANKRGRKFVRCDVTAFVELAADAMRRDQFFDELDAAYSRVHATDAAWQEITGERTAWDNTIADGLDDG